METRLKIIREVEPKMVGRKKVRMVECLCECGNKIITRLVSYNNQHTKSCGCLHKIIAKQKCIERTKHGNSRRGNHSGSYITWRGMVERTSNPNHKSYKFYGGRGIIVCDRWLSSFENFLQDMGNRPEGFTLDRIDPDGNYEPLNCRWADEETQRNNKRVVDKKTKKDIFI